MKPRREAMVALVAVVVFCGIQVAIALRTGEGRGGGEIAVVLGCAAALLAAVWFLARPTVKGGATAGRSEHEDKFRAVFDKSLNAVVLTSVPDGVISDANPAALALFGAPREALIGRTTRELDIWVHPEERDHYLALLREKGTVAGIEVQLRRHNRDVVTALANATMVHVGGSAHVLTTLIDVTERRQTDMSRDRSLSLVLATLESTADGILVVDTAGRVEIFNRTFARMWRLPDEILATMDDARLREFVVEQLGEPKKFLDKIAYLYGNPRAESFDYLEFKDGRVFERFSRPQLIAGEVVGRVWSFRDITENTRREAALRQKQTQLQQALKLARLAYWEYDVPGDTFFFNDQFYSLLRTTAALEGGYTMSSAEYARRFVHPDDAQIVGEEVGRAIASTDPNFRRELDHRILYKDGEVGYVTVHIRVEKDAQNRTIRTHGANMDITERKRAESKFRELFEFAPDGMLTLSTAGVVLDLNRRAEELFGLTRHAVIGREVTVLFPEDARRVFEERFANFKSTPDPRAKRGAAFDLRASSQEGRLFPIEISLSPLQAGADELIVATVRDTTERLRAAERQQALTTQLQQVQKMDALGTLAGGIAHDFNNLLTAILGHAELAALECGTPHPAAEHIAAVREAGLRSRDLVSQILTFSRRTEPDRVPMRLQAVVEDSMRLLRSTVPAMVQIERAIDATCPPVLGDATQIRQVLMNLCTNAWHALPEHGGMIEVRLQRCAVKATEGWPSELAPGIYVRLSVSDNGHGMDAATLARIYDPFFTTKPMGKGTGLGLSMVHGIVRAHDGAIFVRSQPGAGTTFDVYFPAIPAAEVAPPSALASAARGHGERVLYVDDDPLVAKAVTRLLMRLGYTVEQQSSPVEALAWFKVDVRACDLVVTDLAMPGMTGTEFATEVKRLRPDLPVLLMTGYLDPIRDEQVRAAGVCGVLRKPLSPEELGGALRQALG